mgnify:FL=1
MPVEKPSTSLGYTQFGEQALAFQQSEYDDVMNQYGQAQQKAILGSKIRSRIQRVATPSNVGAARTILSAKSKTARSGLVGLNVDQVNAQLAGTASWINENLESIDKREYDAALAKLPSLTLDSSAYDRWVEENKVVLGRGEARAADVTSRISEAQHQAMVNQAANLSIKDRYEAGDPSLVVKNIGYNNFIMRDTGKRVNGEVVYTLPEGQQGGEWIGVPNRLSGDSSLEGNWVGRKLVDGRVVEVYGKPELHDMFQTFERVVDSSPVVTSVSISGANEPWTWEEGRSYINQTPFRFSSGVKSLSAKAREAAARGETSLRAINPITGEVRNIDVGSYLAPSRSSAIRSDLLKQTGSSVVPTGRVTAKGEPIYGSFQSVPLFANMGTLGIERVQSAKASYEDAQSYAKTGFLPQDVMSLSMFYAPSKGGNALDVANAINSMQQSGQSFDVAFKNELLAKNQSRVAAMEKGKGKVVESPSQASSISNLGTNDIYAISGDDFSSFRSGAKVSKDRNPLAMAGGWISSLFMGSSPKQENKMMQEQNIDWFNIEAGVAPKSDFQKEVDVVVDKYQQKIDAAALAASKRASTKVDNGELAKAIKGLSKTSSVADYSKVDALLKASEAGFNVEFQAAFEKEFLPEKAKIDAQFRNEPVIKRLESANVLGEKISKAQEIIQKTTLYQPETPWMENLKNAPILGYAYSKWGLNVLSTPIVESNKQSPEWIVANVELQKDVTDYYKITGEKVPTTKRIPNPTTKDVLASVDYAKIGIPVEFYTAPKVNVVSPMATMNEYKGVLERKVSKRSPIESIKDWAVGTFTGYGSKEELASVFSVEKQKYKVFAKNLPSDVTIGFKSIGAIISAGPPSLLNENEKFIRQQYISSTSEQRKKAIAAATVGFGIYSIGKNLAIGTATKLLVAKGTYTEATLGTAFFDAFVESKSARWLGPITAYASTKISPLAKTYFNIIKEDVRGVGAVGGYMINGKGGAKAGALAGEYTQMFLSPSTYAGGMNKLGFDDLIIGK